MTFDLRHLKLFTTIVSCGSLGRAAESLHLTQPALSRTLKRLEQQVGGVLFERHTKGMILTPLGATLLPHAALLLSEACTAQEELDALSGLRKGTLRVGTVGSIASVILPQAVSRLLEKWPNLRVEITEGVWDRLAAKLLKHEIDLTLSVALPDSEEIVAIHDCYWHDYSYVVAGVDHPLHHQPTLTLADTLNAKWAVPPRGTGPFEQLKQTFAAQGLGLPNIVVESRSITALKSLVAHSGFLSWMAEPIYDTEARAGVFNALPIIGGGQKRTLTAFRRRHGILPSPAAKLLDELRCLSG